MLKQLTCFLLYSRVKKKTLEDKKELTQIIRKVNICLG